MLLFYVTGWQMNRWKCWAEKRRWNIENQLSDWNKKDCVERKEKLNCDSIKDG